MNIGYVRPSRRIIILTRARFSDIYPNLVISSIEVQQTIQLKCRTNRDYKIT